MLTKDFGSETFSAFMKENKSEAKVRVNREFNELLENLSVDISELMYQTDLSQSLASKPYLKHEENYSSLNVSDINAMNSYNALRYLYRKNY